MEIRLGFQSFWRDGQNERLEKGDVFLTRRKKSHVSAWRGEGKLVVGVNY